MFNRLVAVGNQAAKTRHFSTFKAFFQVRSRATDEEKNEEGRKMDVFTPFEASYRNKSNIGFTNQLRQMIRDRLPGFQTSDYAHE